MHAATRSDPVLKGTAAPGRLRRRASAPWLLIAVSAAVALALLSPLALGGWHVSAGAFDPKFSRLDPVAGIPGASAYPHGAPPILSLSATSGRGSYSSVSSAESLRRRLRILSGIRIRPPGAKKTIRMKSTPRVKVGC